jgi:dihydropteroate synthase
MFTLNCRGKLLILEKPLVMGIINLTPDSFYAKSRFAAIDQVLKEAEKMLAEGADILDIGGQSTRPGAEQVALSEELTRVVEPVRAISDRFPEAVISIDSYRATVVSESVAAGASLVNDIGAGNLDPEMLQTVGGLQVPYICMHMRGTPQSMNSNTQYEDFIQELLDFFIAKIDQCRKAAIQDIVIDPGFGFSKTKRHNFGILKNLSVFKMLCCPILLGVSRKSTIYKTLEITADEALNGTTILNTVGLLNGANILRVHDVKEAKEAVRLLQELNF